MSSETASPLRILTVDLEDWFHQIGIPSVADPDRWGVLPSRIEGNTHRLLDLFDEAGVKATFFTLGWVARTCPALVKEVASRGHELACHSDVHRPVGELGEAAFREDLRRALGALEDLVGAKITAFRAPGFSLTPECLWALPVLAGVGITRDASFFGGRHAHGGFPLLDPKGPFLLGVEGVRLLEFPATTLRLGPVTMAPAGGGYFRLLPYAVVRKLVADLPYVMSYIHPRDLDPDQPVLGDVSAWRKFKANVGLKGSRAKLSRLVREGGWVTLGQAAEQLASRSLELIQA